MTTHKVLIVDDEPFICRSLSFVLKKGDYEVVEARNGEEALAAIQEHRPDLVFMDVMMPKYSGIQVTEKVRADSDKGIAATKIVLLTAKGQDADRDIGKQAGATEYMTKPFSPTKILELARELLGG